MQAVDSEKVAGSHTVVDLFLLLILHDTPRRKAVESLLRNKIRAACFTEAFLATAFSVHGQVLGKYTHYLTRSISCRLVL